MSSMTAMIGRTMRHVGATHEALGQVRDGALGDVEVWDTVGAVYSAPYPEAPAPTHVIDVRVERWRDDLAAGIRRVAVADLEEITTPELKGDLEERIAAVGTEVTR